MSVDEAVWTMFSVFLVGINTLAVFLCYELNRLVGLFGKVRQFVDDDVIFSACLRSMSATPSRQLPSSSLLNRGS